MCHPGRKDNRKVVVVNNTKKEDKENGKRLRGGRRKVEKETIKEKVKSERDV